MNSHTGKSLSQPSRDEHGDELAGHEESGDSAQPTPIAEADEPSDLDEIDPDDERWDAFIADDDERDPQPGYGDFWLDDSED